MLAETLAKGMTAEPTSIGASIEQAPGALLDVVRAMHNSAGTIWMGLPAVALLDRVIRLNLYAPDFSL